MGGRREQPQGSRGPDPEVEWTEDETWEEDWESTDREEQGAEETAPETPAPSHLKTEQDDTLALEALGIYEDRVERVEAADKAPPQSPQAKQSQRFAPYHFDYPPRKLEYKYDTKVSKRLSVVLRHDKGEFNLHFFNNATAEVDAILDLPIMREVGARQDTLISCVYYNSKQRFRLLWLHDSSRSGPTLVLGAVQGHSKAVDCDSVHERVDPSRVPDLIHGTHYDFYKKIFKEGLLPGAGNKEWRDQVHLLAASTDLNSKLLPPKCDIVLHIDPALATGCRFYKSANGYYLTGEPIGPQAISAVTIRETKERVEAEKEGSPPLPSIVLQALLRNQLGGRRQTANAQSSESSHRRAYMALWQHVRLGCLSTPKLQASSLQPLSQELRRHWYSRPPKGGAEGRQISPQQDLHRVPWNLPVHLHPDRTWRFHDPTHQAGGTVMRLACSSLVSLHLLLSLLLACLLTPTLVVVHTHPGAHNVDYMAYTEEDPRPNKHPNIAYFGGRAASVPSPTAQLSALSDRPLSNLGWVR